MGMHRVRIIWSGVQGSPFLTTLHFNSTIATSQDAADAAVGFVQNIDNVVSSALTWSLDTAVDVIDEATGALLQVNSVSTAGGSGSASGDLAPFATQGLIKWVTSTIIGGRLVRGRTFIPGVTEGAGAGAPGSDYRLGLAAAVTGMLAQTDAPFVIWHRPGVAGNDGDMAPVSGGVAWNQYAVLRSRRD